MCQKTAYKITFSIAFREGKKKKKKKNRKIIFRANCLSISFFLSVCIHSLHEMAKRSSAQLVHVTWTVVAL